ncbi:MAG: YicC/YloC family endoribonuclease [Desulfosalsimonas sp.]
MIKSMTAFSGAEKTEHGISTAVEIRGVNSRYLDVVTRLPSSYAGLEDSVKQKVAAKVYRGRIEIRVTIKEPEAEIRDFAVNKPLAEAYYKVLTDLCSHLNIKESPGLSHILNASGIIEAVESEKNLETVGKLLEKTMDEALKTFDEMRTTEGRTMAEDLSRRLEFIDKCIDRIDSAREGLIEYYQKRLKNRIRQLTGDSGETDQSRIAQEAAILADKSDISEELTRARSHAKQFRQIMESNEPGGKQLNFLLQEFSREFNTMGVKAASAEISHEVVSAKTELEKLREQVQNIE